MKDKRQSPSEIQEGLSTSIVGQYHLCVRSSDPEIQLGTHPRPLIRRSVFFICVSILCTVRVPAVDQHYAKNSNTRVSQCQSCPSLAKRPDN